MAVGAGLGCALMPPVCLHVSASFAAVFPGIMSLWLSSFPCRTPRCRARFALMATLLFKGAGGTQRSCGQQPPRTELGSQGGGWEWSSAAPLLQPDTPALGTPHRCSAAGNRGRARSSGFIAIVTPRQQWLGQQKALCWSLPGEEGLWELQSRSGGKFPFYIYGAGWFKCRRNRLSMR